MENIVIFFCGGIILDKNKPAGQQQKNLNMVNLLIIEEAAAWQLPLFKSSLLILVFSICPVVGI